MVKIGAKMAIIGVRIYVCSTTARSPGWHPQIFPIVLDYQYARLVPMYGSGALLAEFTHTLPLFPNTCE
jgi:hypothetical protein